MKKIFLLFILFVVTVTTPVEAAKNEWFDRKYDFKEVKKVYAFTPIVTDSVDNEITEKNIIEEFEKNVESKKFKNYTIDRFAVNLTFEEQEEYLLFLRELQSLDSTDLDTSKLDKIYSYIARKSANLADIVIFTGVVSYDEGSVFKKGYTYTRTEYETVTIKTETKDRKYDRNRDKKEGTTTIEVPVTKVETVPDRYVVSLSVYVKFDVYDTKKGEKIFSREDSRYKEPTALEHGTPMNMYKRAIKDFLNDIAKKVDVD